MKKQLSLLLQHQFFCFQRADQMGQLLTPLSPQLTKPK